MTKNEIQKALACDSLKAGKDFRGEKVLAPVYRTLAFVGKPLYAFGDGSRDGWEIGDPDKCLAYFKAISE